MLHSLLNVMYRLMIKTFEPYAQWLRKNCYNHTLIGTFHVFFFKIEPHPKIKKQHSMLLEQAMQAQRRGDIRTYSRLTAEAEEIYTKIKNLSSE
ncbi:hypothetical protein BS333_16685 [Vibrio azureus]|nr:hypothetical protein BS333_16685 [Vibrio azureus]